ncbi:hypothetical protein EYF80_061707 [Liparis tanakae]|uniref:Uncharacterized protein n=1 Tax=Liparis tanakae TaxID=230148 RepID=A0A4Z2EHB5_9TELE|nr:hypothetical protein EYF80_061707 [Liparis tanakae]
MRAAVDASATRELQRQNSPFGRTLVFTESLNAPHLNVGSSLALFFYDIALTDRVTTTVSAPQVETCGGSRFKSSRIDDVCSRGARRLSESLRSERRRHAGGFGPEETRLRRTGSRDNTACRTPPPTYRTPRDGVLTMFTHEPLLQLDSRSPSGVVFLLFSTATRLLVRSQFA